MLRYLAKQCVVVVHHFRYRSHFVLLGDDLLGLELLGDGDDHPLVQLVLLHIQQDSSTIAHREVTEPLEDAAENFADEAFSVTTMDNNQPE
jgi:hypothetical protein